MAQRHRFYQDEEVFFRTTFYTDESRSTAVDPTTVQLLVTAPDGTQQTLTGSLNGTRPANLGKYVTNFIVPISGIWKWKWKTENPRIVSQGEIEVLPSNQ